MTHEGEQDVPSRPHPKTKEPEGGFPPSGSDYGYEESDGRRSGHCEGAMNQVIENRAPIKVHRKLTGAL